MSVGKKLVRHRRLSVAMTAGEEAVLSSDSGMERANRAHKAKEAEQVPAPAFSLQRARFCGRAGEFGVPSFA